MRSLSARAKGVLSARAAHAHKQTLFVPNFCGVRMVLAVVVLGELLAIVLVLAPAGARTNLIGELSLISLFIQWIALSSTGILCLLRRWLVRLNTLQAASASYLLLLAVTAVCSDLIYRLSTNVALDPLWSVPNRQAFLLNNLALCAIIGALALRYFYVRQQWQHNADSEARARIQALQARIRPHFLFNSLNTIVALIAERPAVAEAALQDLADLFRANLADPESRVTLAQEFDLVRRYLHIESLRLGPRLAVEWNTQGLPLAATLPALILQPLVENAIYHGIEARVDGGTIRLQGRYAQGRITLTICNPLPPSTPARHRAGNRMALANIRERLAMAYGTQAEIELARHNDVYCVRLCFPYRERR